MEARGNGEATAAHSAPPNSQALRTTNANQDNSFVPRYDFPPFAAMPRGPLRQKSYAVVHENQGDVRGEEVTWARSASRG